MTWIDLPFIAGIGIICGAIGQLTSGYSKGGWGVHLGLGLVGAGLGIYISRVLEAPVIFNVMIEHTEVPIIWSLVGSVFFVAAIGFLVKPGRH